MIENENGSRRRKEKLIFKIENIENYNYVIYKIWDFFLLLKIQNIIKIILRRRKKKES